MNYYFQPIEANLFEKIFNNKFIINGTFINKKFHQKSSYFPIIYHYKIKILVFYIYRPCQT